ncbi:MAG TPA: cupin domain-containing protein [Syntrophorhabdales bacterium]|nr:cupin domain-containing protein [Syntrophorhabdales bacterium]
MEKRIYELNESDWEPLRKDMTTGIVASPLVPPGTPIINTMLVRVAPGGEFAAHRDPYHHIFYFLQGHGEGWVAEEAYPIKGGVVAAIPAGVVHGYRNLAEEEMVLITLNITAGTK